MHESTTRRQFLQYSTVALSTSVCGRHLFAANDEASKKVMVGAHPWVYAASLPNYDITPKLDQIFADMAYAGMDGIELMHTALRPQHAARRIAELSEEHKLPVIGTSFSGAMWDRRQREAVLEDAELVITRLSEVGGTTLGTSVGDAHRKKTDEELDHQADVLRRMLAIGDAHGVVVNLHNHKYEVVNQMHDLRGTLARVPEAKLGPDLDWLVQAGVDPVAFIHEFAERLVFLHLRDQKADKTWVEALGEGDMDFAAISTALRHANFAGHAVIELAHPAGFKPTRPLRESLRKSRKFVQEMLGY